MEKYIILLAVMFAWKVCAQTTDTTTDAGVTSSEAPQREIASTPSPSSAVPETTSVLVETEPSLVGAGETSEQSTLPSTEEREQATTSSSGQNTEQQKDENTESSDEEEDATPSDSSQQELEPNAEDGATVAQENTTSRPALPVEVTSQIVVQEQEASTQSTVVPESTTRVDAAEALQPQEGTTVARSMLEAAASQEDATPPQPALQGEVTLQTAMQQESSSESTTLESTTRVEVAEATQQETIVEQQETSSPGLSVLSDSATSPAIITPSTTEDSTGPADISTESTVGAAIQGGAVIETEDTSTDPSAGDGDAKKGETAVGGATDEGAECPTDCKSGTGDPICGSDQRVYESECHLARDTCGKNITVASWELCRGKHDICPAHCLNIQDPVCGEDGKIYANLCLMYKFNCGKRMRTYDLVRCVSTHRGFRRIDGVCPKVCHDLYRPVCGSNRKVYSNECYLRLQTCGRRVHIVEMSQCVDTPACPHKCTPLYDPVCGSDGRMYLNHCYFANLTCGLNVVKVDLAFCESFQRLS